MIKIEREEVVGWEPAIRGMRNPLESWKNSDSEWMLKEQMTENGPIIVGGDFVVGKNDLELMKKLAKAGSDERKFARMIVTYVDITAPLYFWKEFDTYKVGTVANSCSTMHKLHSRDLDVYDFSIDHLEMSNTSKTGYIRDTPYQLLKRVIDTINSYREEFMNTREKDCWWQMIQMLPSSYNQKRTVMMNYEVIFNMYQARKNHKLDEWRQFCKWAESLPNFKAIFGIIGIEELYD